MNNQVIFTKITNYILARGEARLTKFKKAVEKDRKAISDCFQLEKFEAESKNEKLMIEASFIPANWLTAAAKRANQISIVTHALKFTHTDARGTSIYSVNSTSNSSSEHYLCTASVENLEADCVGNAAALDVANLLQLKQGNKSLIDLLANGDYTPLEPFANSPQQLQQWVTDFTKVLVNKELSSHTLAKQVFFPVDASKYHLLAPLFASSLAQVLYHRVVDGRFSDSAKNARKARKDEKHFAEEIEDYPNLVIQKFGGTKPQNVSQLNASRRGTHYLFSCAPPYWDTKQKKPPCNISSIFDGEFNYRAKPRIKQLQNYLLAIVNKSSTKPRRQRREHYIDELIDMLFDYAAEVSHTFPAGWSSQSKLTRAQQLWLDPHRQHEDDSFREEREQNKWQGKIASDFGHWLNRNVSDKNKKLILADAEWQEWYKCVKEKIQFLQDDLLTQAEFAGVP